LVLASSVDFLEFMTLMMPVVYCGSEDRAVETAEENRRLCEDIVMILGRANHHEIPSTSFDVALMASFLEYFRVSAGY
jgi:hypothetical protein